MRTNHQHDLGRLAQPLARGVHKMRDPFARTYVLGRSGFNDVSDRDSHAAGELAEARRGLSIGMTPLVPALLVQVRPAPAPDDLVELMAEALVRAVRIYDLTLDEPIEVEVALVASGFSPLDAGRPELVTPAVARAQAMLRRTVLLDCAGDTAAFGTLLLSWCAGFCLLCPPAHAAARDALITDERLFNLATYAPVAVAALCLLLFCFREHGKPLVGEEPPEPVLAPPTAPALDDLRRVADRG